MVGKGRIQQLEVQVLCHIPDFGRHNSVFSLRQFALHEGLVFCHTNAPVQLTDELRLQMHVRNLVLQH